MLSGNASNDAVTVVGLSFPSIAATANHRRTGAREFLDGPDETLTALGEGCKTNERFPQSNTHVYVTCARTPPASIRLGIEQIYQLLNLESETRPSCGLWLCRAVLHTPGYTLAQLEASS